MVRRLPSLALALVFVCSLAATASAAVPARQSGVVLNVLRGKHQLRLVEGARVIDVPYRGTLPVGVSSGARLTFALSHLQAVQITVKGRTDRVTVQGFVVRGANGLELRLADDDLIALPKTSRLQVGALVRVVVRFTSAGSVATPVTPGSGTKPTTTTTTPSTSPTTTTPAAPKCARSDCTFDTIGSVLAIDASGAITVLPVAGGPQLVIAPGTVSTGDVYVGDFVHVVGTQSSSTLAYTLATLEELVGCDNATCTLTLDASIDEVDSSAFIAESFASGDEYLISATAAQLGALQPDEQVHIVGTQDPATGNYTATTITQTKAAPPS